MNSEWGRGGMYETNITEAEGVKINQSRVIRGGGAMSFQIFPSVSPLPAPVIPKLPSYTDLTGPFVAHSATRHHTTINHRLLEPLLTLVSVCTLKE